MDVRPITPTIAIAGQPTEADLSGLKAAGYTGVVNLRNDGEPEQPLGTAAEGAVVVASGLEYIHSGVGGAPLSPTAVSAISDFIDQHAKAGKVLVHCKAGGRAAAMVLLQQARAHGWPASEVIDRGQAMGLAVAGGLKMLVEQYLEANPTA